MKEKRLWLALALAVLGSVLIVISGFSQEDITTVHDSAFGERMRPAVSFKHDEHNEIAGIEDCITCHHVYEDGKKSEYDTSEGQECSECHTLKNPKNPIPLATAYHQQCKGCHVEKKAGPVMCGECHKKK